ncbi:CbtA family protein [Mangrovicella endophytica]|uniref:CbtA family protein n=1 Tax=Mangrovicella endophytica TaxID=2066697 RepID=UPI000C9DE59C|nr:CbtA family protein [Mangrovicella endophytica]
MIGRFFLAALAAGLFVGALMTPVHYARLVPLILHAETFESGGAAAHDHAAINDETMALRLVGSATAAQTATDGAGLLHLVHSPAASGEEGDGTGLFESRLLGTFFANIVAGAGFALVLAAISLLLGVPLTAANGALWGVVGFFVASLAPAIGLAPELPAMPAADLAARQTWWIATVALTGIGAYLLILRSEAWAKIGGLVLVALPQIYGAPQPDTLDSPVPATLAAEFASSSLATAAVFWLVLGLCLGLAMDRFGAREA